MEIPNIDNWALLIGIFGPALVGAVTGLNTPKNVKALLAICIVTAFSLIQVWQAGQITEDIIATATAIVVTWQAFYGMLWKGTGINTYLQEKVPVKFGEVIEVEPVVADEEL